MKRYRHSFKNILKSLHKRITLMTDNVLGLFYVSQKDQGEKAYLHFKKGVDHYPKNYILNKKLALLEMERENWQQAIQHWEMVYCLNKNPKPDIYLEYAKALYENNEIVKSGDILKAGNTKYPNNKLLICKLAELVMKQKNWEEVVKYMECYFTLFRGSQPSYDKYKTLLYGYKKLGQFDKAEDILKKALEEHPDQQLDIQKRYIDILIDKKDWLTAIEKIKELLGLINDFEYEIKLSMLHQIIGNVQSSKLTFKNALISHKDIVKQDDKGYRKIIVYDNGESRIELYKKLQLTESVMVSFDSINMEWQNPSFAFKLLMRQSLDIIAIRKRRKKTYQQDLTQSAFLKTVTPMVKGYKDKLSYGFSLGAYNALYFASLINCRILAYSPRLSIHPEFGRTKIIPKFEMKHELSHPYNEEISPIIVYDPQNKLDHKYITESVTVSFPNSHIVKIPYGGHGIAPHLLKMGVLKEFLIKFINGEVPVYDRKLKTKSNIYFSNLGEKCYQHNKFKWALELSKRALDISPTDEKALKLKEKVLTQMKQTDDE